MSRLTNYVAKALDDIIAKATTSGGRNNALNKLAFQLAQFIEQGITEEEVWRTCERFAAQWELDDRESTPTIRSGITAGMQNPRDLSALVPHLLALQAPFKSKNPLITGTVDTEPPPGRIAEALRTAWSILKEHPLHGVTGDYPMFMNKRKLRWRDMKEATTFELDSHRGSAVVDALKRMVQLDQLSPEEMEQTGWTDAKGFTWVPQHAKGFFVPLWSPVWADAPVAYRMRVFNYERANLPKCVSMSKAPLWRDLPIIHPRSRTTMDGVLVILEGEPDYLTLALPLIERGCSVIALPGSFWRPEWNYLLKGRSKVVFAAHQDDAGYAVAKKVGRLCMQYKVSCSARFPVYGDWSDARQCGTAIPFLVDYILGG